MKKSHSLILKIAIVVFILAVIFLPGISKYHRLLEEEKKNEEFLLTLQESNTQLEKEKELFETDPLYAEKVAREKLGIGKEGEVVVNFEEE